MTRLTLALDWTPNINHIGFFIAKELGYYKENGIQLDIIDPSSDDYLTTPAKKVEIGKADFALCPTESVISYRTKSNAFDMIAIAAVMQEDLSAIVTKKDSGIGSPKQLDGKIYSSYQARYEDKIVEEMIKNDGGKGNIDIIYPAKLNIWDTFLDGIADATWIFINWEGVQAQRESKDLQYFQMKDYQIPYSYSPVIAASESRLKKQKKAYRAFLQATKKGYLYGQQEPDHAVRILAKYLPEKDLDTDLPEALRISSPHFGNKENWGKLDPAVLNRFLAWLREHHLEEAHLKASDIAYDHLLD